MRYWKSEYYTIITNDDISVWRDSIKGEDMKLSNGGIDTMERYYEELTEEEYFLEKL